MTIMAGDAGEAAAAILDEHVRVDQGACGCSWQAPAGTRGDQPTQHARHVLHELAMAGIDLVWR